MTNKELNDVQEKLETYLVEQVEDGNVYFKSKFIADDLDLTSKTVGTNLGILQEKTEEVAIESWSGGSSGTTWRITHADDECDDTSAEDSSKSIVPAVTLDD